MCLLSTQANNPALHLYQLLGRLDLQNLGWNKGLISVFCSATCDEHYSEQGSRPLLRNEHFKGTLWSAHFLLTYQIPLLGWKHPHFPPNVFHFNSDEWKQHLLPSAPAWGITASYWTTSEVILEWSTDSWLPGSQYSFRLFRLYCIVSFHSSS